MALSPQHSPFPQTTGFAPGTGIATERGEVAVEDLKANDRILTMDHGYRRLIWSGALPRPQDHRPVLFPADSLGPGLPQRPLHLGVHHRLLLSGPRVALHIGDHEALATADHLAGTGRQSSDLLHSAPLFQLLLGDHELILANGIWCESLFADANWFTNPPAALGTHLRDCLRTPHIQTARTCLSRQQTAAIMGPIRRDGGLAA